MKIEAKSPEEYISCLTEDRAEAMTLLRNTINGHLPEGFKEAMSYGMIGWVVPHERYPKGYHCDPKLPLPFLSIANQKNFIALYHMGLYADPVLLEWFTNEYARHVSTKLDMGKSCIRFKKPENIPFELISELARKMSADEWVNLYEKNIKR